MSLKKYPSIPGAGQPPYIDWSKVDPFPDTSGIELEDDEIEDDDEDDENSGEQGSIGRFFSWLFGT